ncbi:MAG TPA: Smr/MutS family protein [Rhizomicrobium sp.]|nr:Smr/MutS family protein [Rhizomicrobium sp.]
MRSRKTTDAERELFVQSFAETRPLKAVLPSAAVKARKPAPVGETGLDGRTDERLRRGALAPDARLDLHGLTEAGAHRTLLLFLRTAQMRGCKLVLVVTGKGARVAPDAPFDMELQQRTRGVLKSAVPRWLGEREFAGLVAGSRAAHRRHGGEGALYVYLRKER